MAMIAADACEAMSQDATALPQISPTASSTGT